MENLLNEQEKRRLEFMQMLYQRRDWTILADLAATLDCSTRILKDDIQFINNHFDEFEIQTSIQGIKLHKNHKGMKIFCQKLTRQSANYQLIEKIFLNPNKTVTEIAEILYISQSTLYRMIDRLNTILPDLYGFSIETKPCQIVGDEKKIRYFFYVYFFETYYDTDFVFDRDDEKMLDMLLTEIVVTKHIPADFAYFNVGKVITLVNYTRYKSGHLIDIEPNKAMVKAYMPDTQKSQAYFNALEEHFDISINDEFFQEVFPQYVQKGMYFTLELFEQEIAQDQVLSENVDFLCAILTDIAFKNNVQLPNLEELVFSLFNTAYIEYMEPQSGYILYNRNGYFAAAIRSEYPNFYHHLYTGMKEFREHIGKPLTESGIEFYIYTIFTWWDNLVPELQKRYNKIKILVISDRHKTHADMMKGYIEYAFNDQIMIDYYEELRLDYDALNESEYDIIVGSFPLEILDQKRTVYISNVPCFDDYLEIRQHIDEIRADRRERYTNV